MHNTLQSRLLQCSKTNYFHVLWSTFCTHEQKLGDRNDPVDYTIA